jgi:hypothetical protein
MRVGDIRREHWVRIVPRSSEERGTRCHGRRNAAGKKGSLLPYGIMAHLTEAFTINQVLHSCWRKVCGVLRCR